MATKPRTLNSCWELIKRIERERDLANEAYHKLAGECTVMLSNRDREFLEKCKRCTKGIK